MCSDRQRQIAIEWTHSERMTLESGQLTSIPLPFFLYHLSSRDKDLLRTDLDLRQGGVSVFWESEDSMDGSCWGNTSTGQASQAGAILCIIGLFGRNSKRCEGSKAKN